MTKEWNLSNEIEEYGCSHEDCELDSIHAEDVKEFIKLLKQGINNDWGNYHCVEGVNEIEEMIDKLAGDKLI